MLDRTRIRAPIAGTVLQVHVKPGEVVTPSPEQPIVTIGDPTVIVVKSELDERADGCDDHKHNDRGFPSKRTEWPPCRSPDSPFSRC